MLTTAYVGGSTDVTVSLRAFTASTGLPKTDITNATSGLTLAYKRNRAADTTFAAASQTVAGAHTDGGIVHTGAGEYRVDIPDAAVAAGVDYVTIKAYGVADTVFTVVSIDIMGSNPRTAALTTTNIRDALLNWEPYTGYSLARLLRVLGIVMRGTLSGGRTGTEVFTAPAGVATVTATTDANGNRSAVSDTASGTP